MSMDTITVSQLNDLLTKTGNSTDAAGVATLFAQLARIYAAVDQVEGYTDTLETLLGLTGDVANGNGNIMQRLAQLIAYTDTLEATVNAIKPKTDSIGTNADAAGLNTIFALLKKLDAKAGGVDYFAMTNNIQTYNNNAALNVAANSFVDLLTINGKGLNSLLQAADVNGDSSKGFSVIIDGVEITLYKSNGGEALGVTNAGNNAIRVSSGNAAIYELVGPIKFMNSLTLRYRNISASASSVLANTLTAKVACMMV